MGFNSGFKGLNTQTVTLLLTKTTVTVDKRCLTIVAFQ